MKIIPLGKRVLVEILKNNEEQKTESGIILISNKKNESYTSGKVISVGEVDKIKVGDEVFFDGDKSVPVHSKEGREFVIVNIEDIYALILN